LEAMAVRGGSGAGVVLVAVVVVLLAGQSDGRQMKLTELKHASRNLGANEWWDAVTGMDEYGDSVTTFMHKRWGTAFQLYHDSRHTYLPFRFIPDLSWVSGDKRPEALMFYGPGEVRAPVLMYPLVLPPALPRTCAHIHFE
jgi:hypothetical protein